MELKLFARGLPGFCWKTLQPRFTCWPSPIPSCAKLPGKCDETYSCLVQSSSESVTPPITEAECQAVEVVEPRKKHRSTAPLRRRVKKQKVMKCCCFKQGGAIRRKLRMHERTITNDRLVVVVHAVKDTPDQDGELFLDACDLFADEYGMAEMFLLLSTG